MAFTKIVSVGALSADAFSVTTAGVNTTGADVIWLHVSDYTGEAPSVVSDSKSNTWAALTTATGATEVRSRLLYCLSPVVGSGHTFSATQSGVSQCYPSIQMIAFSGANAYDQETTATGSAVTSKQPGSLTPPSNGALFIAGIGFNASNTMSINSSFTKEVENNYTGGQAEGGAIAYLIQGTAGAVNPTWSWASACEVALNMATMTAAAGGGAAVGWGPLLSTSRNNLILT